MRFLALVLAAFALVSCNRDPNYVKQKYLESGNKYFAAGRLHEASIYYRKAIDTDRKFGEAWYRLALTSLKEGSFANAVPALRRAVELLKPNTPDSNDATLKLCEIVIVAAQSQPDSNAQLLKEAQILVDGLLKRNPASWEGHKLTGDLDMIEVGSRLRSKDGMEAKKAVDSAVAEYRKALVSNPGDYTISLALGRTLVLEGEVGEAESIFKSLIQKDNKNSNAYNELYKVYLAQRRIPEAEALLKSAIQNMPKDTTLRLMLAQFYFGTNRRPELVTLLGQMKANLKEFPLAYLQAGDFFARLGQFDEAMKQYEEGIQKDPSQKIAYLHQEVEAFVRQNKIQLAYAKNDEILKIDPKDNVSRGLKATFLLDKGDVTKAMSELQSVVTASPTNFLAHFNLGRAHFARGEYEQARQEFDRSTEIRPDYLPARLAQTQVSLLRGDNEAALHQADELLRISPNSIQGKVMKAAALQRVQKYDEARALLGAVLEKSPNQVETLLEMGVLDLNQKKNKDAIEHFKKAYDTDPSNMRGLLGESQALLSDGQAAQSVALIQGESQKHPDRLDLLRELGNSQLKAGQFDNAIVTYQTLLTKTSDAKQQGDLYSRMAQCYRYKGDLQHSIESLEKSHDRLPDNAYVATNLAMLYDEIGKKEVAKKYYETAIKINQNDPFALNNLAYLIAESNGDLDQALTYATRAKQRLPNYPEITDTLGQIYLKKNLVDSAIDNFRTVVVQAPQNATYHFHYAMALNQKGDRESARKECQAALADKPSKAQEGEIRTLLGKLG